MNPADVERFRTLAIMAVIRAAHPLNLDIQRQVLTIERRLFGLSAT